ncbi:unannotated protein [freshwater metagenome]|uniref:Unannotated protein n=1 Tax=freshwater metagenome TaxID=449393 RepID=A0A6J7EX72_9ZZZZ
MKNEIRIKRFVAPLAGSLTPIPPSSWTHPAFDFQQDIERAVIPTKLYLVPTLDRLDGEDFESDPDFAPVATSAQQLPDIEEWVRRYVLSTVEIWSGRRSAMQLARWSHRRVFLQLIDRSKIEREMPKIRKIYIQEPIDGVVESLVTLRFGTRIRSLVLRFEGVDRRWLCTEFSLL